MECTAFRTRSSLPQSRSNGVIPPPSRDPASVWAAVYLHMRRHACVGNFMHGSMLSRQVLVIMQVWKHVSHPKMKNIFDSLMCPPSTVYIHRLQYPPPVGSARLTYSLILLHVYTSLQDIFEKSYLL